MVLFLQVLLGPDDAVLSDELNHASIIDGIRLCRAKRLRYKHMDLSDLESRLKESQVFVDFGLVRVSLLECIIAVRCRFEAMLQMYRFTWRGEKSAGVSLIS